MKLTRRNFLKACAASGAALAVDPFGLVEAVPTESMMRLYGGYSTTFYPNHQYGDFVLIRDWHSDTLSEAKQFLMEHINATFKYRFKKPVPPSVYAHKIKLTYKAPTKKRLGLLDRPDVWGSVAWKYN